MTNPRRTWLGIAVLLAVTALGWATLAYGRLSGTSYHGHTSQRQKISLRIVEDVSVRRLAYRIVDACPNGKKMLRQDSGFPPMPIVGGRFGGTFYNHRHGAKIVISGSVSKRFITGSLWDRTRNKRTHRLCNGRTRFRIRLH